MISVGRYTVIGRSGATVLLRQNGTVAVMLLEVEDIEDGIGTPLDESMEFDFDGVSTLQLAAADAPPPFSILDLLGED